ncbi:MAG: IS110 family transposase [Myxococcota bacterium]
MRVASGMQSALLHQVLNSMFFASCSRSRASTKRIARTRKVSSTHTCSELDPTHLLQSHCSHRTCSEPSCMYPEQAQETPSSPKRGGRGGRLKTREACGEEKKQCKKLPCSRPRPLRATEPVWERGSLHSRRRKSPDTCESQNELASQGREKPSSFTEIPTPMINVGIDVSKARLEVAVRPSGECFSVSNDDEGLEQRVQRLAPLKPERVVMEPTGGHEIRAVQVLASAGLPVVVVNARQMRQFAQATGKLAKTDRIDADVIAQFGEAIRPETRVLPDEGHRELEAMVSRRRQLIDMRAGELKRRQTAPAITVPSIDRVIEFLTQQVKDVDDDLGKLMRSTPLWREADHLLQSVPGVGPVVSATLTALVPKLGTRSHLLQSHCSHPHLLRARSKPPAPIPTAPPNLLRARSKPARSKPPAPFPLLPPTRSEPAPTHLLQSHLLRARSIPTAPPNPLRAHSPSRARSNSAAIPARESNATW